MKTKLYPSLVAALCIATAAPAAAQDKVGPNSYAVTLQLADLHPDTPEAARRMLARIENAALTVCGASSFSLREVKLSVRRSTCWRNSVAETVTRIDAPLLTLAHQRYN
ncbi:UrcA family protein [Novosphingobium mangrovi (ex Huang et al. 2023)]|uniref:UrcA family protein n=1 Tax=Novosphingobium mangrovi (ex Huang et al. 2023) TaxID=2976432 RepID=A0ABT2I9H7_9SPHN|nr:UrcA family protein [Novosphingobium mangrovi (ex Huang et al. 2023)]MCT2401490.1 UrcA family protein [Novosphingobium mangrovi (ex Huang et al. 2023)]